MGNNQLTSVFMKACDYLLCINIGLYLFFFSRNNDLSKIPQNLQSSEIMPNMRKNFSVFVSHRRLLTNKLMIL